MKKKKATKNNKVYVFEVSLDLDSPIMGEGKINKRIEKSKTVPWKEIAMLGNHTLYDFAEFINKSFGFMFDHCFGFYSNIEDRTMHDSEGIYELFNDLEDVEHNPEARGVKGIKILRVFRRKGAKMLYCFDYGDDWNFYVVLKEIKDPELSKSYPVLSDREGQNPEQYPPIEE